VLNWVENMIPHCYWVLVNSQISLSPDRNAAAARDAAAFAEFAAQFFRKLIALSEGRLPRSGEERKRFELGFHVNFLSPAEFALN